MFDKSQGRRFAAGRAALMLGAAFGAPFAAQPAWAQTPAPAAAADNGGIEEIIVTAERRSESLQRSPLAITALGGEKLGQLQVQSFNDFAKLLPSVSFQSAGPGTAIIYFRGIATGGDGNHSGPLPSVGVYLDDAPITTIGGTIDLHVYDIARIEALAGPQGTLYGASSQAGTIRYISNQPQIGKWAGGYDLELNHVNKGAIGGVAEGFVNIPLGERAALRLVGWYDRTAGYIDNVPGTRTYGVPGITINNAPFVAKNYNFVDTAGGRAALRFEVNDNLTITPSILGQSQISHGFFGQDPNVGDLQVRHYAPERAKDEFYQAALTIEGKISDFDITYSGSYFERRLDTQSDYSDYSFFYDAFYTDYVNFIKNNAGQFIDPSQRIDGHDRFSKLSQELRIASPQDKRIRVLVGAFYQRQTRDIEQDYLIKDLATNLTVTGRPDTWWLTKQYRIDRDYAIFGQIAVDIVDGLVLTGGGRVYKYDNSLVGYFGFGANNPLGPLFNFGEVNCLGPATTQGAPCTNLADVRNGKLVPRVSKGDGFTHKLNLAWQATPDLLAYFTWSRGFRPGGINRNGNEPPYGADFLTNYEVGVKSSWFDNKLRANVALFDEEWKGIQSPFLGQVGLTIIQNAGNARIRGAEFEINAAPIKGLNLTAAGTYTDARLVTNYCRQQNGANADCTAPAGNFIRAPIGTQLPITPEFKGSLLARYEFPIGRFDAHVQGSLTYDGPRRSALRPDQGDILGRLPGYAVGNLAFGVAHKGMTAEVYVNNIADGRGNLSRFAECSPGTCGGITYQVVNLPRTVGIKFGQRF